MIVISEFGIPRIINFTANINLPNYSSRYTPTEIHPVETLPYIKNIIAYKPKET